MSGYASTALAWPSACGEEDHEDEGQQRELSQPADDHHEHARAPVL